MEYRKALIWALLVLTFNQGLDLAFQAASWKFFGLNLVGACLTFFLIIVITKEN